MRQECARCAPGVRQEFARSALGVRQECAKPALGGAAGARLGHGAWSRPAAAVAYEKAQFAMNFGCDGEVSMAVVRCCCSSRAPPY